MGTPLAVTYSRAGRARRQTLPRRTFGETPHAAGASLQDVITPYLRRVVPGESRFEWLGAFGADSLDSETSDGLPRRIMGKLWIARGQRLRRCPPPTHRSAAAHRHTRCQLPSSDSSLRIGIDWRRLEPHGRGAPGFLSPGSDRPRGNGKATPSGSPGMVRTETAPKSLRRAMT